jgi:ATP-dependent DNA ligase
VQGVAPLPQPPYKTHAATQLAAPVQRHLAFSPPCSSRREGGSPLARERRRPAGFILPCQPTLSDTVPSGPLWLHEIKHDGYRILARKDGNWVRLSSRNGRGLEPTVQSGQTGLSRRGPQPHHGLTTQID